jgi:TonB family protein
MEILSDTMGDDFGKYMKGFDGLVVSAWYPLIPEECYPPLGKKGTTILRIKINRDGTIASMHLEDSTHDQAIDRAAWGAFTSNGQFPPFPKNFKSDSIELRATFKVNEK